MSPKTRILEIWILSLTLVVLLLTASDAGAQVQIFKAPQAFPAGPNPIAEATGDFNGDGKMDVAVANNSAGTVSVMLGIGDGTFQAPGTIAVGNGPAAIVAGDFNGDGRLDLAVANSTDGSVSILRGNGDGTFQAAVNYVVATGVSRMTVGDFNGDGKLDLAVTNAVINGVGGDSLGVILGNGDGTFQPVVSYRTGYPYHCVNYKYYYTCSEQLSWWIVTGDFNGDGKPDLLLSAFWSSKTCGILGCHTYSGSFLELFAGNGDGTFQSYASCCSTAGVFGGLGAVVADFNADGKLDVASAFGGIAYVLVGNGDGTFQGPAIYGVGLGGYLVGAGLLAVGDLNGDGKLDLAVTSSPGGVNVLLGNGDGTFQASVSYAAGPSAHGIAIGDFDGDGQPDLVVTNAIEDSSVTVLLGNGDGTFGPEAPKLQLGGAFPLSLAVGDFNGDGKLDYVVADSSGVNSGSPGCSVVLGNGDGTFQSADFIPVTQGNPAGVATADLNGDGKVDLAVANGGTGVLVLLGNGDGSFQPPVSYSTPHIGSYPAVAIGDLNGDSKPDLATTDGNGHVDILLGNGDGTFQGAVSYPSGQPCNPNSVAICMESPAIGDFNGDGKLDLAVPDVAANTLNILLGNGDGTFQAPVTYSVGAQPTAVAVADLNGNGKLDLAVGNNSSGTISILLGKGDGTFQPAMNYPVAGTPGAIVVGDFNGDGILDVAAQGSGMASVLLGKGDGTFQAQLNYAFGDAQLASGIAAGDFNGDHMLDLVLGGGLGTFGDTTAAFLLNVLGPGYVLYLTKGGTGAGTVTSVPSGINCNPTCSARFASGMSVALTAAPSPTSNFTGWSGACSGPGTCSVTMNGAASVTANFALQDFSLTPASTELSLQHGGQGNDVITITGLNGPFTNAIQLTCVVSGTAPPPGCSLSATSVTPGSNSVTSNLTVTAPAKVVKAPLSRRQNELFYALCVPLLFGITVVGGARKLRRVHWELCGVLLLLLIFQTACGTGGSFSNGGNGNNGGGAGAPPRTSYIVTVMAASGAIHHSIQLTLNIQ